MNPLVSVIIPSYNRPDAFVRRAIDSALAQTYENLEIVLVDDNPPGSAARAALQALLEAYRGEPRVRAVFNERNLGGSQARNEGVKAARGEYLAFLDDDDEHQPDKTRAQVTFMLEHGLDMSFSDFKLVDDAGRVMDYRSFADIPAFDRESLFKYHLLRHMTGTTTFMYRAEALRRIGGFQSAVTGQEFYLMQRTIEQGLKIGYLPGDHIVAHYHDQGRISSGAGKVRGENALYAFKKRYFDRLTPRERRFVRFRHFAVLTVVYKRNKDPFQMLGAAAMMCLASPGDVLREGARFLRGRARHNQKAF
jgi:glycosyltransferase involved in cell wall biosynthesis